MSRGLASAITDELASGKFSMAHLISIEGNSSAYAAGDYAASLVDSHKGANFLYTDAPANVSNTVESGQKYVYSVALTVGSTTGTIQNLTNYLELFNEQVGVGFEVSSAGLPWESYTASGYTTFPAGTTITAKSAIGDPTYVSTFHGSREQSTMTVTFSEASELTGKQFLAFEGYYPYQANGFIMGLDGVQESSSINIGSLTLGVSSVNQTLVSDMLENGHLNRKVTIRRAFLDSDNDLISGAVFQVYSGRIEGMTIKESGEESVMELSVANHWVDFNRDNGRQTNNTSQQHHFENDVSMEFAPQTGKKLLWGEVTNPASEAESSFVSSSDPHWSSFGPHMGGW